MTPPVKETPLLLLTLLASSATLLCCALPLLLVSLGLGATVAALTSTFPALILLSQHKVALFGVSAGLLLLSGWLLFRPGRACPPRGRGEACAAVTLPGRVLFWFSLALWLVGFSAAWLALPLRRALGL